MADELSEEELGTLKTAHDMVGSIAIIEIPESLVDKETIIADAFLHSHKSIKTVVKKAGEHEGAFRTQRMQHLAGDHTLETVHTELGVKLKMNVEQVYYSTRSSTERKRVYEQIVPGENVLVMFSGCGPFPLAIARNTEAKRVVGIELNPMAHAYGLQNVQLNKLDNVELLEGDVRMIVPKLGETFDRIIMPLPHTASDFVDLLPSVSKPGTIIHLYDFEDEPGFYEKAAAKLESACQNANIKCEILTVVKCGQFSPHRFRVCVDFKIL